MDAIRPQRANGAQPQLDLGADGAQPQLDLVADAMQGANGAQAQIRRMGAKGAQHIDDDTLS